MKKTKIFTIFILFSITALAQEWNIQHEEPGGNRLRSVSMVTENIGYAAGENGKILKTTDGETWTDISLSTSTYIFSIHFIDANTGYIAGSGGMLKKTIDGGSNWVDQQIQTDKSLMCVSFLNQNLGFVVGRNGTILKTNDGGANWVNLTNLNFSKHINDVHIIDSDIIYLATDSSLGSDSLRKSTDGGQNWVSLQTNIDSPSPAVHFTDVDNGTIIGTLGRLSRTTDGGNNWQQQNSNTRWDLHSVSFIDNNNGYVTGHLGTIRKTTDGGLNWEAESSGTNNILYSVQMIGNSIYVVGTQSVVLKKVSESLSINENSISNKILIYPTITSGKIEVSTSLQQTSSSIKIINLHGKLVQSINLNLAKSKTITLNPTLQNGLYFVRISMNNSIISKKIILKK
ncbi:YCF48-related protein [Polaribacter sp. R77954]|uniref:YCF48-related protein n=1 Tax=Polaribacter sp. R77954 TaxID=3093870 RepID=UPI0037CA1B9F